MRTIARTPAAERETREVSAWFGNMAAYQIVLERWDEALATTRQCLALARRFDVEQVVVRALQHLAAIAALRDDAVVDPVRSAPCGRAPRAFSATSMRDSRR